MDRPSTSVSVALRNDRTLRPVSRSTGSQNWRTVEYWTDIRLSRRALVLAGFDHVALRLRERVL
jgi:hypothetical protein